MPGEGFEATTRDTSRLGNAWGTIRGQVIRSILNFVVPVSIVERLYDDTTGSLFALTADAPGLLLHRPAVVFLSAAEDWELHALNVFYQVEEDVPGWPARPLNEVTVHLFSPDIPGVIYDPIVVAPTVLFGPQLVTSAFFQQGGVRGQGGHNLLNYPFGLGWMLTRNTHRGMAGNIGPTQGDAPVGSFFLGGGEILTSGWDKKMVNQIKFERPLRVLRGRRLCVQLTGFDAWFAAFAQNLTASILYSHLPNLRDEFRT